MNQIESYADIDTDSLNDSMDTESNEIILDVKDTNFTSKEKMCYNDINKFFKMTSKSNVVKMLDIINEKPKINKNDKKISLRLLDWFVTRYSDKYKISYKVGNNNKDVRNNILKLDDEIFDFNVHISYKASLKSYRKKYFDPFRRRTKFYYSIGEEKIVTTLGQLNFFMWAFENDVIKYVEDNYDVISDAMVKANKDDKKKKINIKSSTKIINKDGVNITAQKMVDNGELKIIISFND